MRHPDLIVDELAARQHGVVTRAQLLAAGVSRHQIAWRTRAGRLQIVHRGVFRVGPIAAPCSGEMAAVLACGPDAVLGHASAARLWGQVDRGGARPVHVFVLRGDRRRPGIRVHRGPDLRRDETTTHDSIPVTSPARTLLDLAASGGARDVERAVAETLARRLATESALRNTVARHPTHPGALALRSILGTDAPALTRSEAEDRLLGLLRQTALPAPRLNQRLEGLEVDFLWREERLVVEVDGIAFHSTGAAIRRDRRRDARLLAAGYRVLRVTWEQVEAEPLATIAVLAQALARR